MESLIKVDVSAISLILLVYFQIINNRRSKKRTFFTETLEIITYINVGILICEIISKALVGTKGISLFINIVFEMYFVLIAISTFYSVVFLYYFLTGRDVDKKRNNIYKIILMVYVAFLVVLNLATGCIFSIDINGKYIIGDFYFLAISVIVISGIIVEYYFIKYKNTTSVKEKAILTLLLFMVVCVVLIQSYYKNIVMIGPVFALVITIVNSLLSNRITTADVLTGAMNRRMFNNLLDGLHNQTEYALAFIDMDNLKVINDTYGHNEGDNALCALVEIIEQVIKSPDVIARYGGDEFVILFNTANPSIIEGKISEIEENRVRYNEEHDIPYEVDFSISYDIYDSEKYSSAHDLLKYVDNKMYDVKYKKKHRMNIRQEN